MRNTITAIISCFYIPVAMFIFANASMAQTEFDLNDMPENWQIENDGEDGFSILKFVKRENGYFRFIYRFKIGTPDEYQITVNLNRASQTVFAQFSDGFITHTPHDCWPTIGTCTFTKSYDDGTFDNFQTETSRQQSIHHMKTFYMSETGPLLVIEECFVLDEFGFASLIFGRDTISGNTSWSRTRQPDGYVHPVQMQQLRDLCNAPDFTS